MSPKLQTALNFLSDLFNKGNSYNSIVAAKCAMSSFITFDQDRSFGTLPTVQKYLKGLYQLRPSLPIKSRIATWDPDIVLKEIKTWYPHSDISLKLLSYKLCVLLALLSGQRVQTLSNISIDDIDFVHGKCNIVIKALLKTSKKGVQQKPLEFLQFSCKELCIYDVLLNYLERTKTLRKGNKLIISYQKPHQEVSSDTISRWIKRVLSQVGIQSTAHSTRSLSTSTAAAQGLPIQEVMKAAGWQNKSTFTDFYQIQPIKNFGITVMNGINKKVNVH